MNFVTKFKNNSAFVELFGSEDDVEEYKIEFVDVDTNNVEYSTQCTKNHWAKLENVNDKNISIKAILNGDVVFERNTHDIFNKVYIKMGSFSLGDNIAWMPYVEEYRKVNNVEIILYSPFEELFFNSYPEIIFTNISDPNRIMDVDKKFRIDYGPNRYYLNGVSTPDFWYSENENFDNYANVDYRNHSLQSIAALTLGLPEGEIVTKIDIPDSKTKIKGKYVVVAIQSTAQLKYWNNPFGWERLFDFLKRNGYKVVIIDKFKKYGVDGYFNQAPKARNVIFKTGDIPLSERIIDIKHADMMITISSGLAWLSWAIGTPVVMISGFTKPWNEFKTNCIRIHNPNVCNGCWNDTNLTHDDVTWTYCPKNQDFICSKSIQPREVIDAVKKFMK